MNTIFIEVLDGFLDKQLSKLALGSDSLLLLSAGPRANGFTYCTQFNQVNSEGCHSGLVLNVVTTTPASTKRTKSGCVTSGPLSYNRNQLPNTVTQRMCGPGHLPLPVPLSQRNLRMCVA